MLKLACHVCDQMRAEGDGPLCEDCLDVVSRVHEIKARPLPRNSWGSKRACGVCKAVGYTVNTVSPDGNVLPFPVAGVCSACGGTGRKR